MENISYSGNLKDNLTKLLHLMPPLISLTPMIDHYGVRIRLKFNKSCLKQSNKLTYDHGHRANIYIVYELGASNSNDSDSTLKNCWCSHFDKKC